MESSNVEWISSFQAFLSITADMSVTAWHRNHFKRRQSCCPFLPSESSNNNTANWLTECSTVSTAAPQYGNLDARSEPRLRWTKQRMNHVQNVPEFTRLTAEHRNHATDDSSFLSWEWT